jgi:predicted nucleotidyltransferase
MLRDVPRPISGIEQSAIPGFILRLSGVDGNRSALDSRFADPGPLRRLAPWTELRRQAAVGVVAPRVRSFLHREVETCVIEWQCGAAASHASSKGEPVTSKDVLQVLSQHKREIQRRFAVDDLAIFGSVARDESHPGSDLDVLVRFQNRPDFDRFMNLKFYLEDLFGVVVDLVTEKALRREIRSSVQREAIHVP